MTGPFLELEPAVHDALWRHLLPDRVAVEQAAFAFATRETTPDAELFRCIEWYGVPEDGFASRSALHFELTDETRALVIKRAHDLGASLVEFHSHTGRWQAEFSGSDIAGFREFVPHVWWRLKGRPYVALVVTRSGFDAFAWLDGPGEPVPLGGILAGGRRVAPTGRSSWGLGLDD
jgi:proteasome lid subunit RPN8/RPN11